MSTIKFTKAQYDYFLEVAHTIQENEAYKRLKEFVHHLSFTRYEHCFRVALFAYHKALKSKSSLDLQSLIRGALLHDFYYGQPKEAEKKHWRTHPLKALKQARECFALNDIEEDIIVNHMYPLTKDTPRYKETRIVIDSDHHCSFLEGMKLPLDKVVISD